jgi:phage baseplate assembly protein W
MALYKGFSSFEFERRKTFKITDFELVRLDLLNHIFTRPGERLMMPNFGSIIPELTFEPLDDQTLDILQEDLQRIINFDPRVELIDLEVYPDYDANSVAAHVKLFFIELDLINTMDLNIAFEG